MSLKRMGNAAPKVARSWLRASEVQFEDAEGLSVGGQSICFLFDDNETIPEGVLAIIGAEIGAPDRDRAMEAFHVMTEEAGAGRPVPVDRGPTPPRQYGQDIVLVAGRHREFRHAPNLDPERLAFYVPLVQQACQRFFRKNQRLLETHSYEVADLMTFGLMWAHIFAHKSEVIKGTRNDGKDNLRLFQSYLRQRFGALLNELHKRLRATTPDADTAYTSLTGEAMDGAPVAEPDEGEFADKVEEEEDDEPRIARRRTAKQRLDERLNALPHDKMVDMLREQATCPNRDQSTRRFAAKLLSTHASSCEQCLNRGAGGH